MEKMVESVRVGRNTAYLTAAQLFSQLSSAIYVAVLARYILANGMGKLAIAQAATGIAFVFVNLGLDTLLVRDIAQDRTRTNAYLSGTLWIKAGLSVLVCIALIIFANIAGYPGDTRMIIGLYAAGTILRCFTNSITAVWQAYEIMYAVSQVRMVRDSVNVSLSMLAIVLHASLEVIVTISVVANIIELTLAMVRRPVQWNFQRRPTISFEFMLLKRNIPFAGLAIVGTFYAQVIVLILSLRLEQSDVGYYSLAQIVLTFLFIIPAMLNQALLPALSRLQTTSKEKLANMYASVFRLTWIMGSIMAIVTILFAEPLVMLLFGSSYGKTVFILQIIGVELFVSPSYISGVLLNAINRQVLFSISQIGFLALQVLLALMLVPNYGLRGASVAYVLPSILGFMYYTVVCHRILKLRFSWKISLGLVATVISTGAVLALAETGNLPWLLRFICTPLVFLVFGLVIGIVYPRDFRILGKALMPNKLGMSCFQ
jgi:O-antigen/teichoic acid export membrane protein